MASINYSLSFPNPLSHFIEISVQIKEIVSDELEVILPDWRPGRYELTNYVSNVKNFAAQDQDGLPLATNKASKNRWKIATKDMERLTISYSYFANKMDAGSCVVNEEQLYINFSNCLIYCEDSLNNPSIVKADIPSAHKTTCALSYNSENTWSASDFYELADSPLLASPTLRQLTYNSHTCKFNIFIQGDCPLDDSKVLEDFKKFTDSQINQMDGFPTQNYDFIIQSLPYKHYHGVEHKNSTVLVLGSNTDENAAYWEDLMGVASHELFHTWNVTRIRPAEMSPYDFSKENYYQTGFVTEGFTTYYGDLFLARSGVFEQVQYFKEINTLLKRHFENYGRHHLSLVDSSFDLWIDGYKRLLPGRKVSIYVKGALSAWALDLLIRKQSNNQFSLDNLTMDLWLNFGKKNIGYTKEDIYELISKYLGDISDDFIKKFYEGTYPIEESLQEALEHIGCQLTPVDHPENCAGYFGFRIAQQNDRIEIIETAPKSPSERLLSIGDIILSVNNDVATLKNIHSIQSSAKIEVQRNFKKVQIELVSTQEKYYQLYEIDVCQNADAQCLKNLSLWLGGKS